jgi:HSP20 family protein
MPTIALSEPPFQNVNRQMNKLIDQLTKGYYNFYPSDIWTPNVNLYETEDSYLVCVDLAGVNKDKIDIEVTNQQLHIQGQRAVPVQQNEEGETPRVKVHLMEIDHGSFRRHVELPHDVHHEQITATYENGLLWIQLPKK